jgi:Ribbon-helix-helix protein, copG family
MYTALYMAAVRTQIYLSSEQRARLDELRRREGKSLAEVIRDAVDAHVAESGVAAETALAATFGAAPDVSPPSRDEWDSG